ncbi:hypothetical protein [Rivularia sp. UHCC 0363]|uniref:hypothetical protein n=1 Tax=Rivularia sp. UHCC 0363 TaxID=3110244 RepID=UPI003A598800
MLSSQKIVGFPFASTLRGTSPKWDGFQQSEASSLLTSTTAETLVCGVSVISSSSSQAGS